MWVTWKNNLNFCTQQPSDYTGSCCYVFCFHNHTTNKGLCSIEMTCERLLKNRMGGWGEAQQVKCLLHDEDLSSDPQHPHQKSWALTSVLG